MVSVLVVLKSSPVDVEDFDRVVGAGAGELQPGALLLRVGPSVFPAVPSTCSTGPGPPAQPLHRQAVALSGGGCAMKANNRKLHHSTDDTNQSMQHSARVGSFSLAIAYHPACVQPYLSNDPNPV